MRVRTTLPVGTLPTARSAPRRSKLPPGGSIASTIETFLDAVARAENTSATEKRPRGGGERRPAEEESGLHRVAGGGLVDGGRPEGGEPADVVDAVMAMLGSPSAPAAAEPRGSAEPPREGTSANDAPRTKAASGRASARPSANERASSRPSAHRSEAPPRSAAPGERSAARGGRKSGRPAAGGAPSVRGEDGDPSRILDAAMAALGAWHIAKSTRTTTNDAVQTLPSPLRAAAASAARAATSSKGSARSEPAVEPGSTRPEAPTSAESGVWVMPNAEGPGDVRAESSSREAEPPMPAPTLGGAVRASAEREPSRGHESAAPLEAAALQTSAMETNAIEDSAIEDSAIEGVRVEGSEVQSSAEASAPAQDASPSPLPVAPHDGSAHSPRGEEPRRAPALLEPSVPHEPDLAPRDPSLGGGAALASLLRGGGATEARMLVQHPSLGMVTVEIAEQRGEMGVALSAPTLEAAVALRGSEGALRAELREAGTDLRAFRVKTRKAAEADDRGPDAWQPRVTNDRRRI